MSPRARWHKEDLPGAIVLGCIFVAIGGVIGFLTGDVGGTFVGYAAGLILFAVVFLVGYF